MHVFVPEKTLTVVVHNTEEGEGQEAVVGVVWQVEEVIMQLVEMMEVMVTMMLATTMASKEAEGLEVLANEANLQVDIVVEADEVLVGITVEEWVMTHLMITMTTDTNTEIGLDSRCTT